jgi:hypothetical protein
MRVKRLKLLDDTPPTNDACLYTRWIILAQFTMGYC